MMEKKYIDAEEYQEITLKDLDADLQDAITAGDLTGDDIRARVAYEELGLPADRAHFLGGKDPLEIINNARFLKRTLRNRFMEEGYAKPTVPKPPRASDGPRYTPPSANDLLRGEIQAALNYGRRRK